MEEPQETDADQKEARLTKSLGPFTALGQRCDLSRARKVDVGASNCNVPLSPSIRVCSAQHNFLQPHVTAQRWALMSWNAAHDSFMGFLSFQ